MQAPKPRDVLPLAQEITRLETQLADARRRWNALFGVAEPEKKTHPAAQDGLTARILEHLSESLGVAHTIRSVAQALGTTELQAGRTLYRLSTSGRISNPGRGRYMAIEKEVPSEEKTS
jgi:hypothetical protein